MRNTGHISGQFTGDRPAWPTIPLGLLCAFLAIFGLVPWCSFKVSCESSHTCCVLIEVDSFVPTWMPRALAVLVLLLQLRTMASVLLVSKPIVLALAHSWLPLLPSPAWR